MTAHIAVGETWGHRVRTTGPLTPVTVIRLGTAKPPKVYVRFEDFKYEGKHKWILRSQLRVLWEDVDAFVAREKQWETVEALSPAQDTPEFDAAHQIQELFLHPGAGVGFHVFTMDWREAHATTRSPDQLAGLLRWGKRDLLDHPATFDFEDTWSQTAWVLPWPTVRRIVTRTVWHNRDRVLAWLREQDRELEHHLAHGRCIGTGRDRVLLDPDEVRAHDEEYDRPARETIRKWISQPAVDQPLRRHRLSGPTYSA